MLNLKLIILLVMMSVNMNIVVHADELKYLKELKIKNTDITVKREGDEGDLTSPAYLYINNKKTNITNDLIFVENHWSLGTKEIVLISSACGGNSCGEFFSLLTFDENEVFMTELFGNGGSPDISVTDGHIFFKFGRVRKDLPAEVVEYDNGKIFGVPTDSDKEKKIGQKTLELKTTKVEYSK